MLLLKRTKMNRKKTLFFVGFIFTTIYIASCERNDEPAHPNYTITFTTTKSVGETVVLGIGAENTDQADVWIDLNNNGKKDGNENPQFASAPNSILFGHYVIQNKKITIHGKVDQFYCEANNIVSLDVGSNPYLIFLQCGFNQLERLDVSNNAELNKMECQVNRLTALDISKNLRLEFLNCTDNKLITLNLGEAPLRKLSCGSNQLQSLDISKNIGLMELRCVANKIKTLDFSQNPALEFLAYNNNAINALATTALMNSLPQRLITNKGVIVVYQTPDLNAVPSSADISVANVKNWVVYADNNVMQP